MSTSKKDNSYAVLVMITFDTIALPVGIVMWAWACWMTWAWFAPVVSASIPILSFSQCVALRALLAPWRAAWTGPAPKRTTDEHAKASIESLLKAACAPPLCVLIAWLIHLLVHVPREVLVP